MADGTELIDGCVDFSRGQNAAKTPDHVAPNGYYAGINVSTQKGCLGPRFAWKGRTLKFPEGGVTLPSLLVRPYKNIFEEGKFQAAIPYRIGQEFFHIIIISGVIFLVNRDTLKVSQIPIEGGSTLNQYRTRVNWSDAGKYLVIYDYPSRPVIIENGAARRSIEADYEVPISTQGVYNNNRLFIVNGLNSFTAGDPVGNLLTPKAPITFEEVLTPGAFLNQFFDLTSNYGNDPITAILSLQKTDQNTGIGSTLVSTASTIWSYQTQNPRSAWTAGVFGEPFVRQSGIVGPRAYVHVGGDIFFLSSDGQLRSVSMSREEQSKWSKVPLSLEVENWLKYSDETLAQHAFLSYFNNYIFVAANPFRTVAKSLEGLPVLDVAFGGFVVMNTSNVATLIADSENAAPAWDGLWTGVRPMEMWMCGTRSFVMSKDNEKINRLYEVDVKDTIDVVSEKERYIQSRVYTREFDFKNHFQRKELNLIELIPEELKGDIKVDVRFKPSHSPYYLEWKTFEHRAPYRICTIRHNCTFQGLKAHSLPPVRLGPPDISQCDPLSKIYYEWLNAVQLKIDLTGKFWQFRALKLNAIEREIPEYDTDCNEYPNVEFCEECSTDWANPEENLCHPVTT